MVLDRVTLFLIVKIRFEYALSGGQSLVKGQRCSYSDELPLSNCKSLFEVNGFFHDLPILKA